MRTRPTRGARSVQRATVRWEPSSPILRAPFGKSTAVSARMGDTAVAVLVFALFVITVGGMLVDDWGRGRQCR